MKTFLLISFMLIALNLISCGQKGDLVRPQHVSEQSAEPQEEQEKQEEQEEQNEPDKQDEPEDKN